MPKIMKLRGMNQSRKQIVINIRNQQIQRQNADKYKKMDKQQANDKHHEDELQPKQDNQTQAAKRRGTVKLEQSNGPPQGFYYPEISVLTIGDGDLSFSLSISEWVHYKFKKNIHKFVATTYDSLEDLEKLYKLNVRTNIKKLEANNVKVLHKIDVNDLHRQETIHKIDPNKQGFDRIIWNFPHAGFPDKSYGPGFQWEEGFHQKHINIINCFFKYSRIYLKKNGLILMAHKTIEPFSIWNIRGIAQANQYKMVSMEPFNMDDYPGYENRRGAGKNGAKRFPIEDAVQYVFS